MYIFTYQELGLVDAEAPFPCTEGQAGAGAEGGGAGLTGLLFLTKFLTGGQPTVWFCLHA